MLKKVHREAWEPENKLQQYLLQPMSSRCNIELGGKGGQTFIKEVNTLLLTRCTLAELHLFFCHRYPPPGHDNCAKVYTIRQGTTPIANRFTPWPLSNMSAMSTCIRWACARFRALQRGSCAHAFWPKAGAHAVESCAPFSNGARFPDGSLTVPCTVPVTVPCYDL